MAFRAHRRRDYRVELELETLDNSTSADSRGHPQKEFVARESVWAHVEQLSGQEGVLGRELAATASHRVELDYDVRITPRARLRYPDTQKYLHVEAVDDVEGRGRTMVCLCRQEVRST